LLRSFSLLGPKAMSVNLVADAECMHGMLWRRKPRCCTHIFHSGAFLRSSTASNEQRMVRDDVGDINSSHKHISQRLIMDGRNWRFLLVQVAGS
jgi:hypothetical protein